MEMFLNNRTTSLHCYLEDRCQPPCVCRLSGLEHRTCGFIHHPIIRFSVRFTRLVRSAQEGRAVSCFSWPNRHRVPGRWAPSPGWQRKAGHGGMGSAWVATSLGSSTTVVLGLRRRPQGQQGALRSLPAASREFQSIGPLQGGKGMVSVC